MTKSEEILAEYYITQEVERDKNKKKAGTNFFATLFLALIRRNLL